MSDVPSRLLNETLRDRLSPPPSSGCLDADMLAAWCDGTLNRRDRTIVESHAAECARCQAILAAMAKTAPPLPARKWWQTSTVRWLAPVATVSVLAVVVWMNVPSGRQPASVARVEVNASPTSAPVAETQSAAVAAQKEKPTVVASPLAEAKRTERRAAPAEPSAPAAAETAPPPVLEQPAPPPVPLPEQAAAPVPPPPAPAAAPAVRSASGRNFASVAEAAKIAPAQTFAARLSGSLEIVSPDRNVRWRVVAGTTVERSIDRGTTWQPQSIGVPVRLVTGTAPSSTICWLVGTGGVVLLSTDGQTWQRAAFPEPIDLTAVLATDGSRATVTASDGRAFTTTDGGKTWTIVSSR
jgi:hypothetical protein